MQLFQIFVLQLNKMTSDRRAEGRTSIERGREGKREKEREQVDSHQ